VSLNPPLVSVTVAHTSTTWPVLKLADRLGISVLAQDHGPVARSLAAKGSDRFASVAWESSTAGTVFVKGSALWLECWIEAGLRAGDHDIVLMGVDNVVAFPKVLPMVFHGSEFRELLIVASG
jgi:flavin reductase (DIM6/NTAB) family NADH-FMN oxidoreductase RutF